MAIFNSYVSLPEGIYSVYIYIYISGLTPLANHANDPWDPPSSSKNLPEIWRAAGGAARSAGRCFKRGIPTVSAEEYTPNCPSRGEIPKILKLAWGKAFVEVVAMRRLACV